MLRVQSLQTRFLGEQELPTFGLSKIPEAIRKFANIWRTRRTVWTLSRLDDEVLQDIGVDRRELLQLLRTETPSVIPGVLQALRTARSASLCGQFAST
jgi:uncharacterized protein YjiS (DUF1127 family)